MNRTPITSDAESKTGFVQLVKNLLQDLRMLLRDEVALLRREVEQDLTEVRRAAIRMGGAVFLLHAALLAWSLVAVVALDFVMDLIWAATCVAVLLTLGGLAMAVMTRRHLSAERLRPEETFSNLQEDKQWLSDLREQVSSDPSPSRVAASATSGGTSTSAASRSRKP